MVMWNLVGYGIKWTARGIEAFSRTEAGKKTAEVSGRAIKSAMTASKEAVQSYRNSKGTAPRHLSADAGKWKSGQTVVTRDGQVGLVVRYLRESDIGGSPADDSLTQLVLLDLLQYTSELDRYLFIHESSLRAV